MREDTGNLLDDLSQTNFRYVEFKNRFYVNSTWKLFSAILCDPRILGSSICAEWQDEEGESAPPADIPARPDIARTLPLLERYSHPVPLADQPRDISLRSFFASFPESE